VRREKPARRSNSKGGGGEGGLLPGPVVQESRQSATRNTDWGMTVLIGAWPLSGRMSKAACGLCLVGCSSLRHTRDITRERA
jgi:hypothetical protein